MTLMPSYGRDYNSAKDAEHAFREGKDFTIADVSSPWCGKQCSIRDLKGKTVTLRYKRLTKAITIVA